MLFVIHATDRPGGMATRAKFYRAHRIHLDQSDSYDVDVVTAGTLLPASSIPQSPMPPRAALHCLLRLLAGAAGWA